MLKKENGGKLSFYFTTHSNECIGHEPPRRGTVGVPRDCVCMCLCVTSSTTSNSKGNYRQAIACMQASANERKSEYNANTYHEWLIERWTYMLSRTLAVVCRGSPPISSCLDEMCRQQRNNNNNNKWTKKKNKNLAKHTLDLRTRACAYVSRADSLGHA